MPRIKKRDGVYYRKDCKQWWVSYIGAEKGKNREYKRVREPAIGASSHDEAVTYREEKRAEVRKLRSLKPGDVLECNLTFAEVADKFLAYQRPRLSKKGFIREQGIIGHLKAFFAGELAEVTPAQVSDYVTSRLNTEVRKRGKAIKGHTVSKSSVRKELVTLKHLYRLACGEWKMLPRFANPTVDVQSPKFNDERTQHLTPDQFRRLLAASPEKMKPIFALLTATGMRRSELVNCKWKLVEQTRILLPTSKNGEWKEIHLNSFSQRVLASIPHGGPEDNLFPNVTPEAVSMAFRRVCKLLGFSHIRPHDLRHTFATWLRQGGVELDIIASQLGHRDLRMTKRYAKIAASQVSEAVNGLDPILGVLPESKEKGETPTLSHKLVTEGSEVQEGKLLTA